MLSEPTSPTSSEDEFDTSELLNQSLLQQDEVTHRLSQAGPIGVATAAAILSARVGLQACIVSFRPGKPETKSDPTFKVHGAAPLCNVIRDLQGTIIAEMNATLHQQTPQAIQPKPLVGETLHELWANVRSDVRKDDQKKTLAWTDALRRIVLSCYLHHGRIDLLPEFTLEQLQQLLSPEAAEHLQVSVVVGFILTLVYTCSYA